MISSMYIKLVMRTLIDIPQEDLALLNQLGKKAGKSRAELVRQAISAYLEQYKAAKRSTGFGLWKNKPIDGVDYQNKIRGEWK